MNANVKPYDAEVEYLEVSEEGQQAWIDTGYVPTGKDIDMFFKFMINGFKNTNGWIRWIGTYAGENSKGYDITSIRNSLTHLAFHNGTIMDGGYSLVKIDFINKVIEGSAFGLTRELNLNGESYELLPYDNIAENTDSFKLFSFPIEGFYFINEHYAYGKIYYARLDKGGVPVFDLIPVRVDDVGYMYDRVSGKLFGNVGAPGSRFILGPDI